MRATSIAGVLCIMALPGCSNQQSDALDASVGRPVTTVFEAGSDRVAVYDDASGTCFSYSLAGGGGVHCMRALQPDGWAVEVSVIGNAGQRLLLIAGHERTRSVRLPRRGAEPQKVILKTVDGVDHPVAVLRLLETVDITGNGVTAYDASGSYLGRTHDCGGDPNACGPFDGPLDQSSMPG